MSKKIILMLLLIPALCVQGSVSRHRYGKIQKSINIEAGKPRIIKGELADTIWQVLQRTRTRGFRRGFLHSSSLHPEKYNVSKIFDKNFSTCWAEGGRGFGRGEWVIFHSSAIFWIYNGMWRSKSLFYANNRVKRMKISFYNVYAKSYTAYGYGDGLTRVKSKIHTIFTNVYLLSETVVDLPDGMYPIEINKIHNPTPFEISPDNPEVPFEKQANYGYLFCRLEILDVYRGLKYNDTCISEIISGGFDRRRPDFGKYVY